MKILIIGGGGFLGYNLAKIMSSLDHDVSIIDKATKKSNLSVNYIQADIFDNNKLIKALKNIDIIYYLACTSNPIISWENPLKGIQENVTPTINVFIKAVESGVKKIVFPSSGGTVYGKQKYLINEKNPPQPFSPYAIEKIAIEYYLNYFKEKNSIAYDVYRIANMYGKNQPIKKGLGVIGIWMNSILNDKTINLYGDKETKRDYVYVEDVAYLMTHSLKDITSSDTYNIGTGNGKSIINLLNIFKKVINRSFKVNIIPRRFSDNQSAVLNSKKLLKYFPDFKYQKVEDKIYELWTELIKDKVNEI